jgi:hypothetical protein
MNEPLQVLLSRRPGLGREEAFSFHRPGHDAGCPACGGRVLDLRGSQRCTRCGLTLCIGCDGGMAEPEFCSAAD